MHRHPAVFLSANTTTILFCVDVAHKSMVGLPPVEVVHRSMVVGHRSMGGKLPAEVVHRAMVEPPNSVISVMLTA